jgi:hypothetical protein
VKHAQTWERGPPSAPAGIIRIFTLAQLFDTLFWEGAIIVKHFWIKILPFYGILSIIGFIQQSKKTN